MVTIEVIILDAHLCCGSGGVGKESWGLAVLMGKQGRHTHASSAKEAPRMGSVYGRLWAWGFSQVVVGT